MKFMNMLKKSLVAVSLVAGTFNLTAFPNQNIHAPIYHPDGHMAWNGNEYAPFYYDNYSIVWAGLKNPRSLFSYKNGSKVWDGFLYRDYTYNSSLTTIYHMNGQKAWGGMSRKDSFYDSTCAIYHA
ncbi:MAG TPA: hypothetical protein PLC42_02700, partial [Parachlamydiaceae bacterium]|nr:hypothetical protein [Parachlamydiaceae bacterium]